MLIQEIILIEQSLIKELLNIWERSVRSTHFFLTEEDIQRISVQAEEALRQIPILMTAENQEGSPVAFMGVQGDTLEMLFVSPEAMGQGAGKQLLQYGIERHGVRQLCVNEQNPKAKAFYEYMGFHVSGRMECDEQGNPFPLLKMELSHGTDEKLKAAARLFDGWNETSIWSCLQGHMGYVITDEKMPPASAQIVLGDFCFFAGRPDEKLAAKAGAPVIIPRTEDWFPVIEKVWEDKVKKGTRYSIKKEPHVFDREKLNNYAASLPEQYELKLIDKEIYDMLMAEKWSSDLCAQFSDAEDYEKRGIGVVALSGGIPVAGASSYSIYSEGIEIEIDTREDCRRKGLATACGARLILECLDQGLYPSWDAHDLRSVALAEKLGYHRNQAYTVYFLQK